MKYFHLFISVGILPYLEAVEPKITFLYYLHPLEEVVEVLVNLVWAEMNHQAQYSPNNIPLMP